MPYDRILILDFGSQVTQLIARRVREARVYSDVQPGDVSNAWLQRYAADGRLKGIILSGSHASATGADTQPAPTAVFELGVPVLGICYGMQTMARQLGGRVRATPGREFGPAEARMHGHTALLADIGDAAAPDPGRLQVWMSHGDQVTELPPGFGVMASTPGCAIAGMANEARRFYGLQFHPEVTHTRQGRAILERFVLGICGARPGWTMAQHVDEIVLAIRHRVGNERVLLGLSGGVDSSVAAALIHRAIGDQLTCVLVDHGLLRQDEARQVLETVAGQLQVKVVHVDASARFLAQLEGVTDPEQKRKIIGREFIAVFKAEAAKLMAPGARPRGIRFLAQGTIYPDVIESGAAGSHKAATIKSHHNVGGLPEQLGLELLEPLRNLFKDEVRELGLVLGLPSELVHRHPFPGPGLGVRILGEVKKEYADMLRQADAIFIQELRTTRDPASGRSWYDLTSQAFVVFQPVKSVGVMGDGRTYEYAVVLRAVQTTDFMTADWTELPYPLLRKVSTRIINEVRGINRVTYDVSSKPPATIEWE